MVMTAEYYCFRWSFHSGLTLVVSLCVLLRLFLRLPSLFLLPLSYVCRVGILEFVARLYSMFSRQVAHRWVLRKCCDPFACLAVLFLLQVLLHLDFFLME